MAEQKERFSFSQTAAQQPERQRFSFSSFGPPKKQTVSDALNKQFPYREMVQAVPAAPKKPTLGQIAKEFIIPGRNFSDQEIAAAKPTFKEIATGGAKAAGEIGVGLTSLVHMGGNFLADKVIPGYDAQAAKASREKINEKIAPFLTPKTAGEAQVMRVSDIAGLAVGWTKAGRLNTIKKALVNVDNTDDARKLLRSNELTDDFINKYKLDEAAVAVKTPKEATTFVKTVDDLVEQAANAAKGTAPVVTKQPTQPRSVDDSPTPNPATPARFSFAEAAKETPAPAPAVREVVDPKNFKTAEEYVKAQGTPVYHGSNKKFTTADEIDVKNGFYTLRATDESLASQRKYLDKEFDSRITKISLIEDEKLLTTSELAELKKMPTWDKNPQQTARFNELTKKAKKAKIQKDGISVDGELAKYEKDPATAFGKEVTDFVVNFKKPLIVDYDGKGWREGNTLYDTTADLVSEAKRKKNDGIIIKNINEGFSFGGARSAGVVDDYIVIDKSTIKTRTQLIDEWKSTTAKTPTQTANAESAEQVIKRQPKPKEIAQEVAETKKWETDPVKAQAEATQEVAAKYSNTVADQGFISDGAAKIDGVPPVKNVRAKARNFAENNDVPIDLPPQTWSQYFLTQVQDTAYRLGFLQKQLNKAGVKISDDANAYLQREAYIGKASAKIEKKRKELGMVAGNKNGLFMRMKKDQVNIQDLAEYMSAKNATDRNKRVAGLKDGIPDGGSGLTNKEAAEILDKYKGNTKMDAYAKEFRDLVITPRLQLLKEAGILTDEQIANITKYEPNYVPSKVAEFDRIQGGGTGFSVQGSGVKGLRGSARKDRTNSVMQAVSDYEDAVQRAEKNKSLQAMGKLIEENPDKSLWEVKGVQYMPQYNEVGELQFLRQRPLNEKTSVEFFKDGKAYEIRIHDEALAKVFTQEGLFKPIAFLRVINNYLRAVNTVINPEFMITNAMRDAQTALVIAGGEKGALTASKAAKDYPKAMKGIWQAVRNESNEGWAKTYNEMVEAGGRTGWFDLKEVAESTKEVSKLVNRYNSDKSSDALMRAVDRTAKLISDVNEAGEMSVRVSVYKQLVDGGMTKAQAANYAKNMTVNFNKRGNIGMLANSLYLFANAGIQGSARLLMAMKNKKVRRITYGIVASSYGINELNNQINPEGYSRIQDFEKERNLIIMLPLDGNKYNLPGVSGDASDGYYFKVPLPYGFNVFKVAGDAAYDVVNGKKSSGEAMKQMLLAVNASFNPLSSGTPIQFISPTVVDPFISSWENKNWFGAPIMPEQPAFAPAVRDSDRYFSGARDLSVETAQFLNRLTGGNEVTAGMVDISPETIDHIIDSIGGGLGNFLGQAVDGTINTVTGDIPTPDEMPFVRKFIDTPFEKGEQTQVFNLLEKSATAKMSTIEIDRFVDNTISALERGDIDQATAKRVTDQFISNQANQYAGEVLSLINEGKTDEAIEIINTAPPGVVKALNKLVKDDVEEEIKRLESQQK